jgi:exopolyphosphatase/guanosine-5'-triphosphate,3'-diphosphate pyrophosphatase
MTIKQLIESSALGRLAARLRPGHTQTFAAVDLGSNSFHLIVARYADGRLEVVDRLQEMVRLGGGLDVRGHLHKDAARRALDCLGRFGERLRGLPRSAVRAVGTNTLRRARNRAAFLARAERALGHPIEVISGQEEARLIYHGVAHDLPSDGRSRLVVDIGGGSTELMLGRNEKLSLAESLHIGCVGMTQEHFGEGRITDKRMRAALTAARLELKPVEAQFRAAGFEAAYGSSGTIRAVGQIAQSKKWSDGAITAAALRNLRVALVEAGGVERIELPGVSAERAVVLAGGAAVLSAVFEALGIERMEVAGGALREGLLYDLVGRVRHEDVRQRTIAALSQRYNVDTAQAGRVAATAAACFAQVADTWGLGVEDGETLARAAQLHEIGLAVAHTKYHRHGAYLAEYSDLPGFSWQEQRLLASLIRGHRRRFPLEVFKPMPGDEARSARRLTVLLRLAVLLHRGRAETPVPPLKLVAHKRQIALQLPAGWLARNPLTAADLEREARYLRKAGIRFEYR